MTSLRARIGERLRRDLRGVRRRFDSDSDRRGMVLIMSLLMVAILTTLGSAAVVHTAADLRESGGYRLERNVYRISEAGAVSMIGMAAQMQGSFENFVYTSGYNSDGYAQFELANTGPVLAVGAGEKDPSFGLELKRFAGSINYKIRVYRPEVSSAVAGYDASRFCFRNYRMLTTAVVGKDYPADAYEAASPGGEAAIATQVVVGPSACGG